MLTETPPIPRFSAPVIGGGGFQSNYNTDLLQWGNAGYGIGYDAVKQKGKRSMPLGRTLSEDLELRQLPRRQLITLTRDLNRNFAIAAWAIRRHLDSVSTFTFSSKTGNLDLDQQVDAKMEWWSRAENCDCAGRHSLADLTREWERCAIIDGDVLVNRLQDGTLQTIEGDRIQTIGGPPYVELGIDPKWVSNGVYVNELGRAISYMVFKRGPLLAGAGGGAGLIWDKEIPAAFADMHGYYERTDQVRGITPISAAANSMRDVYENIDLALLKSKALQLMGIAVMRKGSEQLGGQGYGYPAGQPSEGQDAQNPGISRYDGVDFGAGPVLFDLDVGDEIKVIESATPGAQFQAFQQIVIMIALKSLDIPFSFYDESHTNYSGMRMAGVQYYDAACKSKQARLRALLHKITAWRIGLWVMDGEIKLPDGFPLAAVRWEWVHSGIPLFDPLKEISGDIAAVNAGFSSPQQVCKARGGDFFKNIDERADAEKYAKDKGVLLSTAPATPSLNDPNSAKSQTEVENEEKGQQEEKPEPGKDGNNGTQSRLWKDQPRDPSKGSQSRIWYPGEMSRLSDYVNSAPTPE